MWLPNFLSTMSSSTLIVEKERPSVSAEKALAEACAQETQVPPRVD
jgi:hypothetical protein